MKDDNVPRRDDRASRPPGRPKPSSRSAPGRREAHDRTLDIPADSATAAGSRAAGHNADPTTAHEDDTVRMFSLSHRSSDQDPAHDTIDLEPPHTVNSPPPTPAPAPAVLQTTDVDPTPISPTSRGSTDATLDRPGAEGDRTTEPRPHTGPKTIVDAGRATRELGDESVAENRLLFLWSSIDRSLVNTRMTIRAEDQGAAAPATNLVIQRRELQAKDRPAALGADYELLERLGQGGMGEVYAARQASIDRRVAIKRILPAEGQQQRRQEKFLSEAVVTGELDHPNIVPIYDLGVDSEGALFYSMKCVQGTPWSELLAGKSLAENLEILMKVSDAIAFAHSRQVVHRDLKPENVMLGEFGEVLVMDWGLAIPADRAALRGLGGTPAYMAPEMAHGPTDRVGIHSDVYLLGAILFEILTATPPHFGQDVMECLHHAAQNQIRSTDVEGELMDIARRALQTEPRDRFASVLEFQAEIRQYQTRSASSAMYQTGVEHLAVAKSTQDYTQFAHALFGFQEALRIWPGNEQAAAGLETAQLEYAACALHHGDFDLGLSLLTDASERQRELRRRLTSAKQERAARHLRLQRLRRIVLALGLITIASVSAALWFVNQQRHLAVEARQDAERHAWATEQQRLEADRQRELALSETQRAVRLEGLARNSALDADRQRREAVAAREKEAREAYVARIGLADAKIQQNAFDQARLILAGCPPHLRCWEWGRLTRLANQSVTEATFGSPLEAIAWSKTGDQVAVAGWNGLAKIMQIDPQNCQVLRAAALPVEQGLVHDVAFSHDGRWLAAGGSEQMGFLGLFRTTDGQRVLTPVGHLDTVTSVAFTPDDQFLVTTSLDHSVRIWNVADGRELHSLLGHGWWVWDAALSPDGGQVATASQDGTVMLWSVSSGERLATFREHRGPVYAVAWSALGQIASAGHGQRVLVWRPENVAVETPGAARRDLPAVPLLEGLGHGGAVRCVAFSRDGKRLATASDDNTIRLWGLGRQLVPRKTLRGHGSWVRSVELSQDGAWLASVGHDQSLRFWNLEGYEEQRVLQHLAGHRDSVLRAVTSADGHSIFSASRDRTVTQWDAATGKAVQVFREGHRLLATSVHGSAHGKKLVTAAVDGTVRGWDVTTGVELFRLEETGRGAALAVSRGEDWLATSEPEGRIHVWNMHRIEHAAHRTKAAVLEGHGGLVTSVAFDRQQRVLASGDEHGLILIWNTADWTLRHRLSEHSLRINALAFDAGSRLYSGSDDHAAIIWDVDQGQPLRRLPHTSPVVDVKTAEHAGWVITAASDGRVQQWQDSESEPVWELPMSRERVASVAISPDDRRLAIVESETRRVRVWDLTTRRELERGGAQGDVRPILDLAREGGVVWSAEFLAPWQLVTIGGDEARLWDLSSGKEVMTFGPQGAVAALDVSSDGQFLVTSSWDHSAKVWNIASAKVELTLEQPLAGELGAHGDHVLAAQFAPHAAEVATASADGTIRFWSLDNGRVLRTLPHGVPVHCLMFSADGQWLYTGAHDGHVRKWNARTGELLASQLAHAWGVRHLTLSRDGRQLATAGADRLGQVWRLGQGTFLEPVATLAGHTAAVTGIAFSHAGDRAFTSSEDGTAKVWETSSGTEILNLVAHSAGVTSVSVSPHELSVITTGRDGLVTIWTALPWRPASQP